MSLCFALALTRSRPSQTAGICGIRRVSALSSDFSSSSVSFSSNARNLAFSPAAAISSTLRLSHQTLISTSLHAQRQCLASAYSSVALRFASTGKPRPNLGTAPRALPLALTFHVLPLSHTHKRVQSLSVFSFTMRVQDVPRS